MKLWKFLSLIVLTCTVFNCSKDNESLSQQSESRQSIDNQTALKIRLKDNIDRILLLSSKLEVAKSQSNKSYRDEISALNEVVSNDLTTLAKVSSESDFLSFLDTEVFISKSNSESTPCFDEYSRAYYKAVRKLVACAYFDFGGGCIHAYLEDWDDAVHNFEKCMQETYYSKE